MKNTKICPKCQSNDIVFVKGRDDGQGIGNNIQTGIIGRVVVNRYVCCGCGYTEEWVDTEDIPKIKKKYSK